MYDPTYVPEWAKEVKVGQGELVVEGKTYTYHVLAAGLEPNLPGFIGFPRGEFLFVSEEVPAEFLPHVLGHEVREFTLYVNLPGRCRICLELELEGVPADMKQRYLAYRLEFFRRLVQRYYAGIAGASLDELKREIGASLAYLEELSG